MTVIVEFIASFIDVVVALVQRMVTTIDSIIWLVTNIPSMLAGITAGFAYAPTFLMPFLGVSVSLLIVMFLIRIIF